MAIVIRLSHEQESLLMQWAAGKTDAEVSADCEPSGYDLMIGVSAYGTDARAVSGSRVLELGDCEFRFEPK
ncbi:hypothetical protein ABXT00_13955 [Stenotrophomonas koreensis]|uniref:hypothetical protein n=1 Tax=Stenotrophomonas koreensis TaxID=266128 RepID=UPI003392B2ED